MFVTSIEEFIMLKLPEKFSFMLLSMVYGMMAAVPAIADDTEIYTTAGSITQQTQPNVLFVLDTSGSMSTTVMTRVAYDPSITYTAPGCYDSTRVYLQPAGSNNADKHCNGGSTSGWGWWKITYAAVSDLGQVNRSAVVCQAAASLDSSGYYTGRISQYRSNWRDSLTSSNVTDFVECEGDQGVHGQTTGDAKVWASTSNGPWSSDENEKLNWGGVGFSATIYSGNYLNYLITTPLTNAGTRISVMQDVITDLVTNTTDINIGLMRFSSDADGGMVAEPIDDIENNRADFIASLKAMTANGGTPLSESLYESAMYYQGKSVDYGLNSQPFSSVADSRSGNTYKSPIANECQKNFTILLTDGDPTSDDLNGTRLSKVGVSSCSGNCLDEIAGATASNDQSSSLSGKQVISTYTIGFTTAQQLLEDTAKASFKASGTGEYMTADDANTLADAFNAILVDINNSDTTFSSPAVSVNAFNRSTHLDDLYFTLFKPGKGAHWDGNLKKYKLSFFVDSTDVDGDNDKTERLPFIADATGADAVDKVTGFFDVSAQSYWTDTGADGLDVSAGGAANEFDMTTRKVYTYADTYTNDDGVLRPGASTAELTASTNQVSKTNAAITDVMLGIVGKPAKISGTPLIETLLDWAAGFDVFDEHGLPGTADARLEMGDPLHSEPALVQYGGTVAAPDLVAYVATNDGYLHAIDADDGMEIFSFIPQELLPNLNTLMDNKQGNITYGLDGNVVAWINDINGDGIINGSDHVYLYIGMRRGGRNIYSLDVTDRSKPKLRWVIKGGSGDYAELGQTWSTINVEKVKDGSTEKTVLIFGGGYDTNQDSATVRTTDSVGRAVFIADAESGDLLWSAGSGGTLAVAGMDYSIPARVKPLDMSGDGFIDRLYVADMGGQIFRFDIDNGNGSALSSSIKGGRIADLADTGNANARRFYYPPDVALIAKRGQAAYLALVAGSGYRAHPLNTEIQDRMYLLKDNDVYKAPATYVTLTEADLYDATLNLVAGDGTDAQKAVAQTALDSTEGWFIKLDDETTTNTWIGEKVLSEPLIIEGVAIITTFTPVTTSVTGSCVPQAGSGKVFYLDVLDGSPAFPSNVDVREERHTQLARSGIPPSPNVIITKGGEPTLCIGTECEPANFGLGARKTYWYEVEK
jgi:type IV pilus assembly protein PilY1